MSDADGICGFPDSAYPVFFVKEVAREREHAVGNQATKGFQYGRFLLALLDHYFYPFSLIVVLPRDGWVAATNRMFVPGRNNWFPNGAVTRGVAQIVWLELFRAACRIATWTIIAICYANANSAVYHSKLLDGHRVASAHAVYFMWPLALTMEITNLLRITVVAVKYAYMSARTRAFQRTAPFEKWLAVVNRLQILSSYMRPSVPGLIAECERVAGFDLRRAGVDANSAVARASLCEGAVAELRERAVYDIHRLGIDDKYIEPLTTMLRVGDDGMCSVVALAVAARLSSQPAKFAFRMVRWVPWIAAAFTAFAMSTPFMTPAEQAVAAGGPRQVFLFPFLCECSFVCQETCGCIPLDIPSCIMLVLVSFPIYDNARVNLYFAMAAVVESKRIFKSIKLWGRTLRTGNTWPPRKYANGTAVASPSTKGDARAVSIQMSTSLSYRSRAQTLLSQHGDDDDDEDDDDDTADIAKAVSDKPETAATRHASLLRPPTVQLRSPLNVHSWEIGRQILVRFGKPKRNRIDMYSGFYLLYMALIILAESICVYLFNDALNLQLIFLAFSLFAYLSLPLGTTLITLSNANELNVAHRQQLALIAMGLRHNLARRDAHVTSQSKAPAGLGEIDDPACWSEHCVEHRRAALDAVKEASEHLAMDNEAVPITMIGFPATFTFISSLFSAGAIGVSVLGSALAMLIQSRYQEFAAWHEAISEAPLLSKNTTLESPYANCSLLYNGLP